MAGHPWLLEQFEKHRPRLWDVAYGMLGSIADADDALQDAWIRVSQAATDDIENPAGWLTTVVSRVCLNALRARNARRAVRSEGGLPDPVLQPGAERRPDEEAGLAQSIGLALLVVLDTLTPPQRVAFVLHDLFGLPHAEIARTLDRSPDAARKLASRARRLVRDAALPEPDPDRSGARELVDAFLHAARDGDLDRLLRVLDPAITLRVDFGPGRPDASEVVRGAAKVARRAREAPHGEIQSAIVNGTAGAIVTVEERPFAIMAFTVSGGRIVGIEAWADADRVAELIARGSAGSDRLQHLHSDPG